MSYFEKLNDTELNQTVKNLAAQERKLTQEILEHIAEVDRRRLFLGMAYSSLFDYLTKEVGYSAGAAQRRIDAARLLQEIPEISKVIESGGIHLSQISKLQKLCRQVKKESGKSVAPAEQREVLKNLEHKSSEQTDLILALAFNVKIKTEEAKHIQQDESVRIELTFSKVEMALLKEAQEILSHATGFSLKETWLAMARRVVKQHKKKGKSTATVAVKTVTPRLRREILTRDQSCQFRHHESGKICGSKHFLEVDHLQPRFAQGNNDPRNLRVLCRNHNQYRYRAELHGIKEHY